MSQKQSSRKGNLYLIPTLLGGDDTSILPPQLLQVAQEIDVYIVENVRSARRFLVKLGIKKVGKVIDDLTFHLMDKHADPHQFGQYLQAATKGQHIGLLSEAGCPAVADPGSTVVKAAHKKGIEVIPLVGPSSLMLALMASGMNGQQFTFHGYIPIQKGDRIKYLQRIAAHASKTGETQLFIEAPYRNRHLLNDLFDHLRPENLLCIAADITLPSQYIRTYTIAEWRKKKAKMPDLHKRPVVYVVGR